MSEEPHRTTRLGQLLGGAQSRGPPATYVGLPTYLPPITQLLVCATLWQGVSHNQEPWSIYNELRGLMILADGS